MPLSRQERLAAQAALNAKKASRYRVMALLLILGGTTNLAAMVATGNDTFSVAAIFFFAAAIFYFITARGLRAVARAQEGLCSDEGRLDQKE